MNLVRSCLCLVVGMPAELLKKYQEAAGSHSKKLWAKLCCVFLVRFFLFLLQV